MKWKGGRRDGNIEDRRAPMYSRESQRARSSTAIATIPLPGRERQTLLNHVPKVGDLVGGDRPTVRPQEYQERGSMRTRSQPMGKKRIGLRPGSTHTMGRR